MLGAPYVEGDGKKECSLAHLSERMAIRRHSFSRPNLISILPWRLKWRTVFPQDWLAHGKTKVNSRHNRAEQRIPRIPGKGAPAKSLR